MAKKQLLTGDGLHKCPDCSGIELLSDIRGHGRCPIHGGVHIAYDNLAEYCSSCAKRDGVCQVCGKKFAKKVLVMGAKNSGAKTLLKALEKEER